MDIDCALGRVRIFDGALKRTGAHMQKRLGFGTFGNSVGSTVGSCYGFWLGQKGCDVSSAKLRHDPKTVKFTLDPNHPPLLTKEARERLIERPDASMDFTDITITHGLDWKRPSPYISPER